MIAIIIILTILLIVAGIIILIFSKICNSLLNQLTTIFNTQQELDFLNGNIDIPEEEIAQAFLDTTIIYNIEEKEMTSNFLETIDTSTYEKNHLIGLTHFVQPQYLNNRAELKLNKNEQKIFPHCTIYQLRDGRWLWRQEFSS